MKCPNCGNEVSQEEAFCGQCGMPKTTQPGATVSVNTPAPRGGLISSYNRTMPPPSLPSQLGVYNTGMQPPAQSYPGNMPPIPTNPNAPGQLQGMQSNPQQQAGFYQDATEAISVLPNSGQSYPQQPFPGQGRFSGTNQYGPPMQQPLQTGNFGGQSFVQAPPFPSGQGYGTPGSAGSTQRPPKQQNNTILVFAVVCLVVAILLVSGFGALYLLRNQSPNTTGAGTTPTTAPTSAPTLAPSPTPTPTLSPTPATTPSPTADPGFTLCQQTCTSYGYNLEYPANWQLNTLIDTSGLQFTNPAVNDIFAKIKTPASTTATTSTDLLNADLQASYASLSGYTPPDSLSTTTIAGQTWYYATIHYQNQTNNQLERVRAYAIIYQNKSYIIELQAPDTQYEAVNNQYFVNMIGRFQFQSTTP